MAGDGTETVDIMITRTYSPEDFRACARLMTASDPWITLGLNYNICLKSITAPLREVYIARSGGKIAGILILQMTGVFKGYIQTICVAPHARGKGLGTSLLKFAEKRIFSKSPNVFLCVSSFNRKALKLYKRLGYNKAGVLKDFIVAGRHELLMRKTLCPLRNFYSRRRNNSRDIQCKPAAMR